MSQDFVPVLVKDERLANITSELKFAVKKGGQNVTVYPYKAISASNSAITFNIQVPNRTTVLDRRIMLKATVTLTITTPPAAAIGNLYIKPGNNFGLGPFPIQSLFSTMSMTINSNTVTINIADVLPALLTMLDSRELSRYNGATPVQRDTWADYDIAVNNSLFNSPFGGWDKCVDYDLATRGSFYVDSVTGNVAPNTVSSGTVTLKFTSYEPLLLSPLIWGAPKTNNQGFYGVTNLTFLFNVGSANRVVRTSANINPSSNNAGDIRTISLAAQGFDANSTNLYITYLTPHPSDLLPSRNVVGYYDLPRYISSGQNTLPACSGSYANGNLQPSNTIFNSQSLQLNQCPDKLIIFVRQDPSTITNANADSFFPISSININWNNQSGLLSSYSQYDLWRASCDAGSNLAWNEFRGIAMISPADLTAADADGASTAQRTIGSVLVLDMGRTVQLTDDFLAPGSIGSFNLQFNCNVQNWDSVAYNNCQLVLITMNSGLFVLENGSSSVFTAILDKQTVLETSEQEPYSRSDVARQVGGGFLDSLKSIGKALMPIARAVAPVARQALASSDNKYAKMADSGLKMFGLGHSGGGPSGGLRRKIKD